MGLRRRPTSTESGAAPPEQNRPRLPLPAPPAGRSLLQTAGDAASAVVSAGAAAGSMAGAALVRTASSFVATAQRTSPVVGFAAVIVGGGIRGVGDTLGDQSLVVGGNTLSAVGGAAVLAHVLPHRPLTETLAEAVETVRRGVAMAIHGRQPIGEELNDAMNMVTGHHGDIDLTALVGRNYLNVINHLQDLAMSSWEDPRVSQAHLDAGGKPEKVVENLLALCKEKPPVLSRRAGSSPQPDEE